MLVFAIDPGWSGSIVTIERRDGKKLTNVFKMPENERGIVARARELAEIGKRIPVRGLVENVWARPGEATGSIWKFAGNVFGWRMALLALDVRYDLIVPEKWQAEFQLIEHWPKGLTEKERSALKREKKRRHVAAAQELFPRLRVTLDNVDGLLLAQYAYIHLARRSAHGQSGQHES